MSRIKLLLDVVNDMESLTESLRTLANAIASDEPSAESEEKPSTQETQEVKSTEQEVKPAAKTISVEDVRAVLTPISQSGKTAQVKALLTKYGASRLSDIDPSKYGSLIADAGVLANG